MAGQSSRDVEAPHPREQRSLVGHDEGRRLVGEALRGSRIHHAWLIGGTKGIGKATLAYRFATALLARPAERSGPDPLGVDLDGPTARQVRAQAHPDLVALERLPTDKAQTITVEAVRRAMARLSGTAAYEGYRVLVVDSADDLTTASANALLKTIEEPPSRTVILIVSHAPSRVLPTVRSRCRKLTLGGLTPDEVGAVVAPLVGAAGETGVVARAVSLADGSVSRALDFLDPKRVGIVDAVSDLLAGLPGLPGDALANLADRLADRGQAGLLDLALGAVEAWVGSRVAARAGQGAARLAPLALACEKIGDAARLVEIYNLDRRPFVISAFEDLSDAVRRAS